MKKKLNILLSFILTFILISSIALSFENNKENYDRTKGEWISYSVENVNSGKMKGGHDTLTSEGMLLKKEVHKEDIKFQEWADNKLIYPSFRNGAHDEDTNWWLNFVLDDPPIEPGEWGNFFHHFYNPSTNKGFKRFFDSSLTQAKNYSNQIWQMVCGPNKDLGDVVD